MKIYFKLKIILIIVFFILIHFKLIAQNSNSSEQYFEFYIEKSMNYEKFNNSKRRFRAKLQDKIRVISHSHMLDRSQLMEDYSEKPGIFQEVMPKTVNKSLISEDLLDSVIYSHYEGKFKRSFTYDDNSNRLTKLFEEWDSITGKWKIDERRYSYTYDDSGNMLTEFYEVWDSSVGKWANFIHRTNSYDGSGNVLSEFTEQWDRDSKIWENRHRHTYTYNSSGNLLVYFGEAWGLDNKWANTGLYTYTYDDSGNRLSQLRKRWDPGEVWVNHDRYTYNYDDLANMKTELFEEWNGWTLQWDNVYYRIYNYDDRENLLTFSWIVWDNDARIWVNAFHVSYTYDHNAKMLSYLFRDWDTDSGIWINNRRNYYTYNSSGNLISGGSEIWDNILETWGSSDRFTYTYDGSGNVKHFVNESWSGSEWSPYIGTCEFNNNGNEYSYNCEELNAYYSSPTSVNYSDNNVSYIFSLSQNYPNPFNPATSIEFTLPISENVTIEVFNITGKKIKSLINKSMPAGNHAIEFNASHLASGVYFYKIQAGSFRDIKKMIVIK